MNQLPPNPTLRNFEALVGEWEMESPQFPGGRGRTTFRWLEDGAYLVWRSDAPEPAPSSTWIIGSDESSETCTALYYDTRAVARVYQMSFGDGVWKVWRQDVPGFWQRFTGTLSDDGRTIRGAWEGSPDGSEWKHDFDLIYTKVS